LPDFLIAFGIIAIVLTVASLVSGVVERAPISFPILFLGLGFLVGERGFGVLEVGPHDETLEIVATLTLALAATVIFGIRPLVLGTILSTARMSWEARGFISWFGPRGLNSLLLALIAVAAGVSGAELLMATVGIVVLASAAIHGASTTPVALWYERRVSRETLDEERETTAAGLFAHNEDTIHRMSLNELHERLDKGLPTVVLDVRSRSGYDADPTEIPGSVRVLPDEALDWARSRVQITSNGYGSEHGHTGGDDRELIVTYCA
jgi:NhaP-type Na+/H+ or K+/H+ antiporter